MTETDPTKLLPAPSAGEPAETAPTAIVPVPKPGGTDTRNVLIVGADLRDRQGDGADPRARRGAQRGRNVGLILAGRDVDELDRLAADLRTRSGRAVVTRRFDAADLDAVPGFFADCLTALPGGLYGVVLAHGWMPRPPPPKRTRR